MLGLLVKNKVFLLFILLFLGILTDSCFQENKNQSTQSQDLAHYSGEKLAHIYCAGCHLYTSPEMLPKKIWADHIFPAMGPFMGIYSHRGKSYDARGLFDSFNKDLYPRNRTVDEESWQKMIDFYTSKAPEKLKDAPLPSPLDTVSPSPFRIASLNIPEKGPHSISLVKIDSLHHRIYWGNALNNNLYWLDWNNKNKVYSYPVPSAPVWLENSPKRENLVQITCIGSLSPSDQYLGKLVQLDINRAKTQIQSPMAFSQKSGDTIERNLLYSLPRPVQILNVDLDKDGLIDYLVCGFGHLKGSFFWMRNTGKGFEKGFFEILLDPLKPELRM